MEQEVVTKRGTFGFVRVTIPMSVKVAMLTWCKRSGMGKAEFFRVGLMIGIKQLAESLNAKKLTESYEPVTREEKDN